MGHVWSCALLPESFNNIDIDDNNNNNNNNNRDNTNKNKMISNNKDWEHI